MNSITTGVLPVLYSFRRCPYAIRARMALKYSGQLVELREVNLANKPATLLDISAQGTVPVLQLPDKVINESHDIMIWALHRNDPDNWLLRTHTAQQQNAQTMIQDNDQSFKPLLDQYKYASHQAEPAEYYRDQALGFLRHLEHGLQSNTHLVSTNVSIADIAIFPFIRQFAFVDKQWFDQLPLPALQCWLQTILDTEIFHAVMHKTPFWDGQNAVLL